uniref:PhoLip_ATPase_C domain-containing protein n=1 Tax=Heterorhabditis bacteriophora TaxID=37862 RepID=A0A1I7WUA3_HETBA
MKFSKFTRASYYNFSRIGWAVALAWVISANHLGWGGHFEVGHSQRFIIYFQYVYYTIPITILSYVLAFFWSCLFEVPFLRLEKMLIDAIIKSKRPDSMLDGERKNGKDTLWEKL